MMLMINWSVIALAIVVTAGLLSVTCGEATTEAPQPADATQAPATVAEASLSPTDIPAPIQAVATVSHPATIPTVSEAVDQTRTGSQTSPTPCPSPAPSTPGASDTMLGYVSGRVLSVSPDHIVVHTADKGDVVLYPAYYRIWDNLWVKDIPTEVGDEITASDVAFGGPQLYVNIVNLIGTISNVRREGDLLMFEMGYEIRYTGQRNTDTIKVEQRARVSGSGPREGQRGQVIGRRLKDGTVLATTVFFFDADGTRDAGPTLTLP